MLGSIAAALLNFGDSYALAAAWAFTILACAALFYSAAIYVLRVRMIRARRAGRWYDKWGPSALCVALLVAVAVSFGVRLGSGKREGGLRG